MWMGNGPGKFEEELGDLESRLGITTLDKAVRWAQTKSMWPDTFGLACCAIEMMSIVSARYDIARFGMEAFRASPRQADLLIVSGRVAHKMAAPLRQIYDQMLEPKWVIAMGACASSGGMFNNYTTLQGVDKIVAVDIYVPGCPPRPEALMEGILRLHEAVQAGVPPAFEIRSVARRDVGPGPGTCRARARRTARRRSSSNATRSSRRASTCATSTGFNFLSDISPTDYLGWGGAGVSGYIGTAAGRDLNDADDAGLPAPAAAEAEALRDELPPARAAPRRRPLPARAGLARRRRERAVASSSVWPTADWHEREAWDMMGIPVEDHPNLARILMDDDWEGHPLRKDYPIGGEPVRFSDAE